MSENLQVADRTDIMPIISQIDDMLRMGSLLIKSGMLPEAVNTPEAAVAIMIKGRELGIGMMEAFTSINIINRKPTISPQLMIALAERSGALEDLKITDDGNACTVTVIRRGHTPHVSTFSMENAADMKLAGKNEWAKQPATMRQWRAVSAALRLKFPDVLAGIYTHEEMGADINDEGEVIAPPEVTVVATSAPSTTTPEAIKLVEAPADKGKGSVPKVDPQWSDEIKTTAIEKIFGVLPINHTSTREICEYNGIVLPDCPDPSFLVVLKECLHDQLNTRSQARTLYRTLSEAQESEAQESEETLELIP